MKDSIFILDKSGRLQELEETDFLSESALQSILAEYPNLISGKQIHPEKPRKWLFISREFGVPDDKNKGNRWSLDHLFIDQEGIPTLIEVKRSTDTRIRREVIGQILDYAANAVSYWKIEDVIHLYEQTCEKEKLDPIDRLETFMEGEFEIDEFWESVKTNLRAGKIRMLIVADGILNEQMSPAEILGVEIKQFKSEDIRTLVPRVIGKTIHASDRKTTSTRKAEAWSQDSFLEALKEKVSPLAVQRFYEIHNWAEEKCTRIFWGSGKRGSMIPIVFSKGIKHQLFAIWTDGSVEIYFQYYKGKPPFDQEEKRIELLEKMNTIKGVRISKDKIDKRPNFSIEKLSNQEEFRKFLSIYNWFFEQI